MKGRGCEKRIVPPKKERPRVYNELKVFLSVMPVQIVSEFPEPPAAPSRFLLRSGFLYPPFDSFSKNRTGYCSLQSIIRSEVD